MMGGYEWMSGYGLMAGMGWFGFLMMAVFWISVILLVVWGMRALSSTPRPDARPDALEILKLRFARGEINSAEYEQARAALR